jgi:hypothetical protein
MINKMSEQRKWSTENNEGRKNYRRLRNKLKEPRPRRYILRTYVKRSWNSREQDIKKKVG